MKEHPEAKDQIFKPRGSGNRQAQQGEDEGNEGTSQNGPGIGYGGGRNRDGDPRGHLYDKRTGTLRDPQRSIYYDPTYNPFGAPPPGMPYREKSKCDLSCPSEEGFFDEFSVFAVADMAPRRL